MSIQGRSASDSRHMPACNQAGASSGARLRAAKRIESTQKSHSINIRFPALAAVALFALAGCSYGKPLIKAEPQPQPTDTGVLRTADADALAAAMAEADTSHAAREPGAHELRARSTLVSMKSANVTTPHGWITARGSVRLPHVDAMGQHLAEADTAISDRNSPRAQWQLDEAARQLQLEGGSHAAVHALHAMASRVGQRQWPSIHAFDLLLVKANKADPHHGWGTRMSYAEYVERPLLQLQRAENSYAAGRRLSAASALRDAAVYVDQAARHAAAEAQQPLYASSMQLRKVAARLEASTAPVSTALNGAALHATAALAQQHALEARAEWRAHDEAAAGRELQAATLYVHESAAYGARSIDQHAVDQARQLATRLLAGAHVSASSVDRRISALDRQIGEVRGASARNSS